ncbi:adenylate kinase-like kinase, partial [Cellulophaga geojensis KL-A]
TLAYIKKNKMILVFRYQLNIAIPTTFKRIAETNQLTADYNIIDSENIRERLKTPNTEIDKKIIYHIDNGLLMSDAFLIESLIQDWDSDKKNILVNFPKNVEQLNTLKYYLEKFNDTIDKIIYYKINDFEKIYDIAQINYGKVYDADTKESTIESMQNHMTKTEEMIKKLVDIPMIELDFLNEDLNVLK